MLFPSHRHLKYFFLLPFPRYFLSFMCKLSAKDMSARIEYSIVNYSLLFNYCGILWSSPSYEEANWRRMRDILTCEYTDGFFKMTLGILLIKENTSSRLSHSSLPMGFWLGLLYWKWISLIMWALNLMRQLLATHKI